VELSYDEKFILAALAEGWYLQKYNLRSKAGLVKQVPAYAVDRLQERGFLEPVEIEGRTECCGLSATGMAMVQGQAPSSD
jgi:hypothetical protein